ncbi:MAG: bifunctional adenosylcobinamide kinase/adenosylcobinamide-phosphate guanylyltransferase [Deltaproteobacteria bacterium]|nr:bifunctional adenosylcobinamide kinase/adenosylcobinamide-phosphate guanylyltransferase [Deltaproteobacteria bacterium]
MSLSIKKNILVIGGCRSGKSSQALKLADKFSDNRRTFIATCVPYDDEMKDRVARHQKERDNRWKTVEEPINLHKAITEHGKSSDIILIDCITLWISNLLLKSRRIDYILKNVEKLLDAVQKTECSVIMVSNEVGTGIVPENDLSRMFRDAAGFANQHIANVADQVTWMVAGIPVKIK